MTPAGERAASGSGGESPWRAGREPAIVLAALFLAVAWLSLWLQPVPPRPIIAALLLGVVLVAASAIDLATMRLPDVLTLPLIALGCAGDLPLGHILPSGLALAPVLESSLGPALGRLPGWHTASALVGYGAFALLAAGYERLRGHPGLGLGDAKLLAAAGAWLGMEALAHVVLFASFLALAGIGGTSLGGATVGLRSRLPFGPFLAAGVWIEWWWGPALWS